MDPRNIIRHRIHGRIVRDHTAQAEFQHCPINAYLVADLSAAYGSQERQALEIVQLRVRLANAQSENRTLRLNSAELQDALGDSLEESQNLRHRNLALFRENIRIRRAARSGRTISMRRLPETFQHLLPTDSSTSEEDSENEPEMFPRNI